MRRRDEYKFTTCLRPCMRPASSDLGCDFRNRLEDKDGAGFAKSRVLDVMRALGDCCYMDVKLHMDREENG